MTKYVTYFELPEPARVILDAAGRPYPIYELDNGVWYGLNPRKIKNLLNATED